MELYFLHTWCRLYCRCTGDIHTHTHTPVSSISTSHIFQQTSRLHASPQFHIVTAQQRQGELLFIIPGNEDCNSVCIPLRGLMQCVQQWKRIFPYSNIYFVRTSFFEGRRTPDLGTPLLPMVPGCSISPFPSTDTFIEQHENTGSIEKCKNDKGIQCEKMTAYFLLLHRTTVWINKLIETWHIMTGHGHSLRNAWRLWSCTPT